MLHAKTAVADGQWARVGSSNLNLASWLSNREIDVAIEDAGFAAQLAAQYEQDLCHSTEIVLSPRRHRRDKLRGASERPPRAHHDGGSSSRAAAGPLALGALTLLLLAVVAWRWPAVLAWPLGVICAWLALNLAIRAWRERRRKPGSTD